MTLPDGYTIETARGGRRPELDDEQVAFWTGHGALTEAAARERLDHVVCVLRDDDGGIAAVNSVYDEVVATLGGRRLWVYRTFAPSPEAREAADEMVAAARDCLAAEFTAEGPGPIGVCQLIADRAVMESRLEPVWPTSELMFAGYTAAGEQLRVVYFEGAKIL